MKVTVKWETTVEYEATIEIDDEEFEAAKTDMASFISDDIDRLVADYEETDGTSADIYERQYVDHTGGPEQEDDDD